VPNKSLLIRIVGIMLTIGSLSVAMCGTSPFCTAEDPPTLVLQWNNAALQGDPNPESGSFQHIVVIFQENRTPDNLFQGLCGPERKLCPNPYNLQNFGIDNAGSKVPLVQQPLGISYDPDHSYNGFRSLCNLDPTTNKCRMNGLSSNNCPVGSCLFTFVQASDVGPYLTMAQQYGWANFMFQTNQGPSTPAHAFIFGGTSAPSAAADAQAIFVSENAQNGPASGCLAPIGEYYWMISPQSVPNQFQLVNNELGTLCFSHPTMATLLDNHVPPLSWKYYTPGASSIWTAPNWIREICVPDSGYTQCTGIEWTNNVDLHPSDVLTDIAACKLANMSWIIPTGQNSDHPGVSYYTGGPSWVASIVNAIGESSCKNPDGSSYWDSTAIFITWDDWGGFYDHEPPTLLSVPNQGQGDYQYGFRVPLVVVAAYTPPGYVNNARHDFGSILRFVEHNFGIQQGALNFADARATTNLTGFFNWSHPPRIFQHIAAPLGADYFLHDTSPMEPPDTE
jgi:phospholipase C